MTVQTSPSRPPTKSVGAAFVGILLTLAIFATVMLSFLIAPLAVLLLAYLAFMMFRGRGKKRGPEPAPGCTPGAAPEAHRPTGHGFGSGASS